MISCFSQDDFNHFLVSVDQLNYGRCTALLNANACFALHPDSVATQGIVMSDLIESAEELIFKRPICICRQLPLISSDAMRFLFQWKLHPVFLLDGIRHKNDLNALLSAVTSLAEEYLEPLVKRNLVYLVAIAQHALATDSICLLYRDDP